MVEIEIEMFFFVHMLTILFILLGTVVGYKLAEERFAGAIVGGFLFGLLAFILLPGALGVI